MSLKPWQPASSFISASTSMWFTPPEPLNQFLKNLKTNVLLVWWLCVISNFPLPHVVRVHGQTVDSRMKRSCARADMFVDPSSGLGDHLGGSDQQQTRDSPVPLQPLPPRKVTHLPLHFPPFTHFPSLPFIFIR